jgi:cbb3-type cytochrome oxidase cytochrome c subunit
MPQFFDLTNSKGRMGVLRGDTNEIHELDFDVRNGVEALAIATYLHETSDRRPDIQKLTAKGDAARGRDTFRRSGCLGCHSVKQESMAAPGESGAPHDSVLARGGIEALDAFLPKAVEEASKAAAAAAHAADASSRAPADAALRAASAKAAEAKAELETVLRHSGSARDALVALEGWFDSLAVGTNVETLHHAAVVPLDQLAAMLEKPSGAALAGASPVAAAKAAAAAVYDRWLHNTFAPDLSAIGSKVKDPSWLADWIIDPRKHDDETVMPRFRFEKDPDGDAAVADMVAYLMSLRDPDFEAREVFSIQGNGGPEEATRMQVLDDLVLDYKRRDLTLGHTRDEAIAEVRAMPTAEKLQYAGHRLIRRYGCFGCHMGIKDVDSRKEVDVGGKKEIVIGTFDRAQPIGTELEGWGIKEAAKLDYGNWGHQLSGNRHAIGHTRFEWATAKLTDTRRFDVLPGEEKIAENEYHYKPTSQLVQKTPEELLKMPLFPFRSDEKQVDAVVTFLLGLVKDRIPAEKTHILTEEEKALEAGSRLIAKLNCQGCHRIGAEPQFVNVARLPRYSRSYNYDTSDESRRRDEFEKETWLNRKMALDVKKVPWKDPAGPPEKEAHIELVRGALLNWKTFDKDNPISVVEAAAGVVDPDSETRILGNFDIHHVPPPERVLPVAAFEEGRIRFYFGLGPEQRPQAPPPLVREGERVRGDWLFRFLLDVKPIRPWLKVRMPSFALSQDDARTIVRWFRTNSGLPDGAEAFADDIANEALAREEKGLFGPTVGDRTGFQCNSCHPAGTSLPSVPVLTPANKFDPAKFKFPIPEDKYYAVWREPDGSLAHRSGFEDRDAADAWAKANLGGKEYAVGDPWDKVKWGPDLGFAAARLRPAWLRAWLREPQDFMPGTNMPPFFGGRDPVDGVVLKPGSDEKIDALLRYLIHMKDVDGLTVAPSARTEGVSGN